MATEQEELRTFIEERILAYDPAADVSPGSRADVEVIQPVLDRYSPDPFSTPIEEFITRRLSSEIPSLILQRGDPVDDGVVKPMRVIMDPFRRQIDNIKNNQTFENPRVLNEEEANRLASNYFSTRQEGGYAVGTARLYFSSPRYVTITPLNAVYSSDGLRFPPMENQAISADAMVFNTEGALFYFDIIARAEEPGEQYNIEENSLVGIESVPFVVKVKNRTKFTDGLDKESTEDFIQRIDTGLSERSLVTSRGIRKRLSDLFSSVKAIGVIGFGDAEMQRDLLTGSPFIAYAFGFLNGATASSSLFITSGSPNITDGIPGNEDFTAIGITVGDVCSRLDVSNGRIIDYTVTRLVDQWQVEVTPAPPTLTAEPFWIRSKNRGNLYISDIPGGIVAPQTVDQEIIVANNQVHIGGKLDVYIRGGEPSETTVNLSGVRDGNPLHFGLDLESFGEDADEFVQVTGKITGQATTDTAYTGPVDLTAEVIIRTKDPIDGTTPWLPSQDDVGRYLELLGPSGTEYGLYKIMEILGDAVVTGCASRRVKIQFKNEHTQLWTNTLADHLGVYDIDFRLVELVSVKSRVRDRSIPPVDFDGNSTGVGAEVGDSLIIELGDDAGIYTIRGILSHITEHDTIILDRDLDHTASATGVGDGLRYRIDDELQIDLINPRIPKIPLGTSFNNGDLQTIAGSRYVYTSTTDFVLAGVESGDTLEILEGNDPGKFIISEVEPNRLKLETLVQNTGFNLDFEIYKAFPGASRPLIRVSSIDLLDSSSSSTGITVPYGDIVDARVLGTFSNRAQGNVVESFSGSVLSTNLFEDLNTDFVAKGVVTGMRLAIYDGKNLGEYEVLEVAPEPDDNPNRIRIVSIAEEVGANQFVDLDSDLHYQIGLPSAGILRLYFLEPTSVEILTGISGGRLEYRDSVEPREFRFSEVDGRWVLPASGTELEDFPSNLRVVRSEKVGADDYKTVVEITGDDSADVFESEIIAGDVLEIHQQIPFKNYSGTLFNDPTLGIFGTTAGLKTIAGSNRVSIPENSEIDFSQMGDLGGQLLSITSGPDTGVYQIVKRIDSKTLQLDKPMSATTENILGRDASSPALRDASIIAGPYLKDPTDSGQFGSVGDLIYIFEAQDASMEGVYSVSSVDLINQQVGLSGYTGPVGTSDTFSWVSLNASALTGVIWQTFIILSAAPTEVQVSQVSSKADDVKGTVGLVGNVPLVIPLRTFTSAATNAFAGVERGDRLEILSGVNAGVYPIKAKISNSELSLYDENPFHAAAPNNPYKIWAGVHGSRKMLTVVGYEGSDGLIEPGSVLYKVKRPSVYRLCSTDMEAQGKDGGLYYADLDVEALGPGDDRNLLAGSRLVVVSGYRVDGYTYEVENNTLTFSPYEEVTLTFDRRFLPVGNSDLAENQVELTGRNLQIVCEYSSAARVINDFLRSNLDRTVVADPIARHFLPSYIFTEFYYEGGSSPEIVGPDLENYINNLGQLDVLEVSDLEAFITRRGATSIRHPITLVAVTHDIDRKLIVDRSQDKIGGSTVAFNGTGRTSTFFAKLGEGLIVDRP